MTFYKNQIIYIGSISNSDKKNNSTRQNIYTNTSLITQCRIFHSLMQSYLILINWATIRD